jgi:hypothetical protein
MPELCESPGFPSSSPALDVAILIFASLWVTGCNLRIRTKIVIKCQQELLVRSLSY